MKHLPAAAVKYKKIMNANIYAVDKYCSRLTIPACSISLAVSFKLTLRQASTLKLPIHRSATLLSFMSSYLSTTASLSDYS